MGILDVVLGRDAQGNPSKINMALIALLLWKWYQSQSAGGAQPAPAPSGGGAPRMPRQKMPEPETPVQIPSGKRSGSGNEFDELRDSVQRMPRGGGDRGGRYGDDMEDGPDGEGPGGGGLGDILGDILGGGTGRGRSGGGKAGPGGGGLEDILGDILGGGGAPRGGPGGGQSGPGGGLGDILGDILGGGGGRGRPGARASGQQDGGVLADILSQFDQAGKGDAAKSWVARGDNIPVTPNDIEETFGSGIIDTLASQFGMPRDELLKGLSQVIPEAVDALTPDGRLPTADEIKKRV